MATPPSDDTRMLFKILADGQWHLYDDVRTRVAALVPPGRALRKYEERVEYVRRSKGDPSYDTEANEDERIFYGARACAQVVITSWKGKALMFDGSGPSKRIRAKPGFKSWGVEFDQSEPDEGSAGELEHAEEVWGPQMPAEASDAPEPALGTSDGLADPEPGRATPGGVELTDELADEAEAGDEPDRLVPVVLSLPEIITDQQQAVLLALGERIIAGLSANGGLHRCAAPSPYVVEGKINERCPECGLLVVDREKHATWHAQHIPRPSPETVHAGPVSSDDRIFSLLSDVISLRLDEFQTGMESWLLEQFQQLEARIRPFPKPSNRWSGER